MAFSIFGYPRLKLFQGAFIDAPDGPEFSNLLVSSLASGLPVFLTMSDRKVFVGYPIEFKEENYCDFEILPVFSGYRHHETLDFCIMNNYGKVLKELSSESTDMDLKSFAVTIPVREIVHAHMFDISHYEKFLSDRNSEAS